MRVTVEITGHVASVRLNRPDKHNGLDLPMFEALIAAGEAVRRPDVRVVVLSGEGPSFCAGLDFPAIMGDPDGARRLLERSGITNVAQQVAWTWTEVPVPVIAAVHGAVYGGGLQIALGADLRLAAPDTRASVMELRYGLIPDMGITRTLRRVVRDDVARELVYTARVVPAHEAAAIGLVTRVVDDPLAAAHEIAASIAARSPHAVRAAKALFNGSEDLDAAASLALETALQVPLLGSPNQLEAAMAVMQKREPTFSDV